MTQTAPTWVSRVEARIDARLSASSRAPVALALSGGGDSVALLDLAADWARVRDRPLLALTVDHGLSPDSARWTAFAAEAARAAGAAWRGLDWSGAKPASGLPAAARLARHRLLADAARQAGAEVILFAHTADDREEEAWMRRNGSTLGRLREWGPSPVWPEGRGLMLLRPLLDVHRSDLRDALRARGRTWIEDPANADPRYARSRARVALAEGAASEPEPDVQPGQGGVVAACEGVILIRRDIGTRVLSAVLVCAGGGDRPPRGERLERLRARLAGGETFTAALSGARIEARGDQVRVTREAGEFLRRPPAPLALPPGDETIWDGRWALTATEPGWFVLPAAGRMAALSPADRARLAGEPAASRGGRPVLIRNELAATVLAGDGVRARSLVEDRLARALGGVTQEAETESRAHGATPRNHLFCDADITEVRGAPRPEGSRDA
nr:tRNA lysidine(34) synthetase TilS [Brevundimonas sp. Root1279]